MKKNFKILSVKRLNNSICGNPAYSLIVEDLDGYTYRGKTATNVALGYEVSFYWENEQKTLEFHFTKTGNLIFDRLAAEV